MVIWNSWWCCPGRAIQEKKTIELEFNEWLLQYKVATDRTVSEPAIVSMDDTIETTQTDGQTDYVLSSIPMK